MFLILIFSICSRKPKSNTCIIEISKQIIILTHLYLSICLRERESRFPPRRGKKHRERSPFPFLDDSHRQRRDLIIEQSHRSREISPFAEERKETGRDVVVFLGGEEKQIERTSLAIVDASHPQRRGRFVEKTHRSQEMSPFATERREREREKEKKKCDGSQRHLSSSHLLCDTWQIRNDASQATPVIFFSFFLLF